MFLVLHESVFSVLIMSRTVCVTVSRGNKILTDRLLVNVISTSSLREVLENTDLVLADDGTVVVKCATTENGIYTTNVFHCAAGTMLMEHTPVQ